MTDNNSLSCAVAKVAIDIHDAHRRLDVVDVIPKTLARGALKFQDNRSFCVVTGNNRLIHYKLENGEVAADSSMDSNIAAGCMIIDSKPINNSKFVVTLSSWDAENKTAQYRIDEVDVDFQAQSNYALTSFNDIRYPSDVLKTSNG